MESESASAYDGDWWEAPRLPGDERMEVSIASPPRSPARHRQRLDQAGAGRPAGRVLEADLVDAEEAEPDARFGDMEPLLPSPPDGEAAANDDDQDDPEEFNFRRVYNRFLTSYRRWTVSQTAGLEDREVARTRKRLQLQDKSGAEKERLASVFWASRGWSLAEREQIIAHWRNKDGAQRSVWLHSKSAFLTYNGDWGKLESVLVPENLQAGSDEELDLIVGLCRKNAHVLQCWKSYEAHWQNICKRDGWSEYAIAFEICCSTLRDKRVVRLHAHASVRKGKRTKLSSALTYAWMGGEPHLAFQVNAGRCRQSGDNQSMYYLQCPKKGKVFSKGNIEPFLTYLVSGEWVMNLVQAGKMDPVLARAEIVKTAKNLPRLLQNLDKYVLELREQRLRQRIVSIEMELERSERPFKIFPEIERWKEEHASPRPRYRFLVLVGPSGLGKTQFAKSLVGKKRSLELNMASAPEPNLKEFDHELHDLILFDECSAQKVLLQKKLFQAPLSPVSLGQSTTGCFAYNVWVHAKLLVVASNVWHHVVHELRKADADWLTANSLVMDVRENLWQQ